MTNPDIEAARAAIAALSATDATFALTAMELVHVDAGRAELALLIRPEMTNGAGIAHGGWIFLLADTAFAYAAATRLPGALTTDANIRFHRPAQAGSRIVAVASVVEVSGASLLIDVDVRSSDGERIASFRGGARAPRRVPPPDA